MATTTKRTEDRLAALEQEVYGKRVDKEYFSFWNDAVWIMLLGLVAVVTIGCMVVWMK